jgi:hypothetical protein
MDSCYTYFPTNVLTAEDYAPVQILALKDYYKNYLNNIIDEVNNYNIQLYNFLFP